MPKNSQTEGSQNGSQAAAPQQQRLSKNKIIVLRQNLVSFLQKEKKTYKDLNNDLIQAFLAWNATNEKDSLLQTLAQDSAKIHISTDALGGGSRPVLNLGTQQALIETSIAKLKRALAAAKGETDVVTAFDAMFVPDAFQDIELFQTTLQKFSDSQPSLSDEQKKALQVAHQVSLLEMLRTLTAKKQITADDVTNFEQKGFLGARPELQDIVRDLFGKVIIPEEITSIAKDMDDQDSISLKTFSRIPGLSSLLKEYDLSADTLRSADPAYEAVMSNLASTPHEKMQAAIRAMVKVVEAKDKKLSSLLHSLVKNDFNLSLSSPEEQQYYLNSVKQGWLDSKEGKQIAALFGGLNVSDAWRKNLLDQLFDLSKDSLELTNDKGQTMRIPLRKHITVNGWKGDTLSEQLEFPLPLVFEIDGSIFSGDDEYIREKIVRLLGSHKEADAFDWNGVRIVPGHTLRITNKLNPSGKMSDKDNLSDYKYARRDPEGNILLYKKPGAVAYLPISKEDIGNYTVEVEKPTYHISGATFPTVVTLLTQMKHASELSSAKAEEGIKEWNKDIEEESLKQEFGNDLQREEAKQQAEKAQAFANAPFDEQALEALGLQELKYVADTLAQKQVELSQERKNIEKNMQHTAKSLLSLENQIQSLQQQQPVDSKKIQHLQSQIQQKKLALSQLQQKLEENVEQQAQLASAQVKVQDQSMKKMNSPEGEVEAVREQKVEQKLDAARKDFGERWGGLSGDESLTRPEVGQVMLCQLPDAISPFPGATATWVRAEIVGIDKNGIDVRWSGIEGKLAGAEGQVTRIHVSSEHVESASGMEDFIKTFGKVYKFPKNTDMVSWGMKLKDPNSKWKLDTKYSDWVKMMQQKVDFSSMVKQNTKEKIQYFGATVGDERTWYKVDFSGKHATIVGKDRKGKMVKQTMDMNGFMIFAAEKALHPYSQEDVDKANGGDQDSSMKGLDRILTGKEALEHNKFMQPEERQGTWRQRNMISISSIASIWKDTKASVKTYFDEKQKKDVARAKNKFLKSGSYKLLKKLPFGVGAAIGEMGAGLDAKINTEKTKKINEYKEEIDKNKSDGGSGGTNYIIDTLFTDKDEMLTNPLRAAGYFLWALEQGGPYIRSLGVYEKQAMWVKAILGEKAVPEYRRYMERMKAEALTSSDAALAVKKGELGFMQYYFQATDKERQTNLIGVFGEKYFGGTLGAATYNLWYNASKVQEEYKAEAGKAAFSDVAVDAVYNDRSGDYYSYIVQDRIRNHLGAVKAMAEKVGPSDENYKKWMSAMIYPYLAGKMETKMADPFADEYRTLGRKTAFPFTQYVSDPRAQQKITMLLDIFSKDFVNLNGDSGRLSDNVQEKDPKKHAKQFYDRWTQHADELLKTLNDPGALIRIRESYRPQPGERDQSKMNTFALLNEFIEEKMQDTDASRFGDDFSGDSKIFESHIYNATAGLISSQMTDAANGNFKGAAAKNGQKLWEAMNNKMRNVSREVENLKAAGDKAAAARIYAYTVKNFFRQFAGQLGGDEAKRKILIALRYYDHIKSEKDIDPLQLFIRGKYDNKMNGDSLPDVMNQGLKIYESFLLKHKDLIDYAYQDMDWDLLEVAVGKEMNGKKVYYQSSVKELSEQISSRKEMMKQIKMMQAAGMGGMYNPSLMGNTASDDDDDDDDTEDEEPFYGRAA